MYRVYRAMLMALGVMILSTWIIGLHATWGTEWSHAFWRFACATGFFWLGQVLPEGRESWGTGHEGW